jgi:hypothetical protein
VDISWSSPVVWVLGAFALIAIIAIVESLYRRDTTDPRFLADLDAQRRVREERYARDASLMRFVV